MKNKVDAIFELREAAEEHGRAEAALERGTTPERRDALLDARLALEEKTQDAIEACERCGRPHADASCADVIPLRRGER